MDTKVGTTRPRGLRWVFLLIAALLASVMIPAVASAGTTEYGKKKTDPMTQNALAGHTSWTGQPNRLQKCFGLIHDVVELDAWYVENGFGGIAGLKLNATFVLENWTGTGLGAVSTNQNRSIVVEGTIRPHNGPTMQTRDGNHIKAWLCFSSDWTSQKAGLAVIKGTFSGPALEATLQFSHRKSIDFAIGINENEVLDQHQWIAAWLTPTVPELINDPVNKKDPKTFPKGENPSMAGKSGFDYKVVVKGELPLGDKKGSFGKNVAILPDDYAALAAAFAVDGNNAFCSVPGSCINGWDTHGGYAFLKDSYDSPVGGFDELLYDTVYPNGVVGPEDANLPALEVIASIAPASKDKPLGGAGYLSEVHERDIYPVEKVEKDYEDWYGYRHYGRYKSDRFYEQYIPNTSRGPLSSGTTGVGNPNNFYGYKAYGLYKNWEFAAAEYTDYSKTECVRDYGHRYNKDNVAVRDVESKERTIYANLRPAPYGKQRAIFYTNDQGEAYFHWNPGKGFNYLSIPGVYMDNNGACDLQGKPVLGQSDISVEVVQPYQPVFGEPRYVSRTDKKEILNGFNKALYYDTKTTNNNGPTGWHLSAWYTEIDGNGPKAYERVCFGAGENGRISADDLQAGRVVHVKGYEDYTCVVMAPGQRIVNEDEEKGEDGWHDRIGEWSYRRHGNISPDIATVTVVNINGDKAPVFVEAVFVDEKIKRYITLGAKAGGTPPPVGGKAEGTAPKGAGTSAPTAAQLKAAGITSPQIAVRALKVKKAKFKKVKAHGQIKRGIVFAKFVSPTNKVKAKIQLMGFKNGQLSVLKSFKVTTKANTTKMIRIKVVNKNLAKKVKSVRVTPIKAVGKPIAA